MEYFLNSFSVIFQREVHNKEEILERVNKIFDGFSIVQYYIYNLFSNYTMDNSLEEEQDLLQDFVLIDTKTFESSIEMKKIN